ncbi:hypothetical protein R2R35_18630 [Anaerocolumna sp. AGMB13020]|uniref:hypothetical protein n=1 Tax=Anaerocolumna sp. AGMB13020 TaxID=3081750 RepID=UPI0029542D53|nr:hypothetical protein [Anaerocolumna sp. AGMB13020]WOO35798.1 hypothetical protein R2R35_18630 [Anaerocolumna sp. AGMB13020]
MDLFEEKRVNPMLISEMREAFDSEDYIYEIKWDGIRCITYLDESSTDMRNKRNKMMIPILPELAELQYYRLRLYYKDRDITNLPLIERKRIYRLLSLR